MPAQRGHSRLRALSKIKRSSRSTFSKDSPAVSRSSSSFCSSKASNQIPPQPPWQTSTVRSPAWNPVSSLKQAGHFIDCRSHKILRTQAADLQPGFGIAGGTDEGGGETADGKRGNAGRQNWNLVWRVAAGQIRMPKPESPSAPGFGLRISELGLLSAFGLRALKLPHP